MESSNKQTVIPDATLSREEEDDSGGSQQRFEAANLSNHFAVENRPAQPLRNSIEGQI